MIKKIFKCLSSTVAYIGVVSFNIILNLALNLRVYFGLSYLSNLQKILMI